MAGETITVIQLCGVCHSQVGTFEVKQENLMLTSKELVWCPSCENHTPEVRDLAGRLESIKKEVDKLPKAGTP